MDTRFFPERTIERLANEVLMKYANGRRLSLPIPIERIVEDYFRIDLLWDRVYEGEGGRVLAGLNGRKSLIVFNEDERPLIDATPGLYNTILGHETGHRVLHFDPALRYQAELPGLAGDFLCKFRSEEVGNGWEEVQAHKFMGYVLLPEEPLKYLIAGRDLLRWSVLYEIREECQVTISALVRRLSGMGLIYVDDERRLFPSRAEAAEQGRLF